MDLREIGIVVRNMLLGANLESLAAAAGQPRAAAYYATECRFLYRCLFPKWGLPSKPVWEALGTDQVSVPALRASREGVVSSCSIVYGGPGFDVHTLPDTEAASYL